MGKRFEVEAVIKGRDEGASRAIGGVRDSLDGLERAADDTEGAVDGAAESLGDLDDAAKEVSDSVEAAGKSAGRAADGLDELGNASKSAGNEIDDVGVKSQKSQSRLGGFFGNVRTAGVAAFAALSAAIAAAGVAIDRWFTSVTDAENATNALAKATQNAGTVTATSAQEFEIWAASVQAATTTSADQAKELAALAVQFTKNNESARQLTQTALDYAAATGGTATEAVKQLGKATGGLAGELGELVPEIKDLTAEQLKAGGATDLLAEKFDGAAEAAAKGLAPALEKLSNATSGFIADVTDSTVGTDGLTGAINDLTGALEKRETVSTFSNILKGLGSVVGFVSDRVSVQRNALIPLQLLYEKLAPQVLSLKAAWEGLTSIQVINTQAIRDNVKALEAQVTAQEIGERNQKRAEDALEDVAAAARDLGIVLGRDLEAALQKNAETQEKANEAYRLGVITGEQYGQISQRLSKQYSELTGDVDEYAAALADATTAQNASNVSADDGTEAIEKNTGALRDNIDAQREIARQGPVTASAFDAIASAAGRAAAVQAALSAGGGGSLVLGGTRINLPGGGSRLTSDPRGALSTFGRSSADFGGGTFGGDSRVVGSTFRTIP